MTLRQWTMVALLGLCTLPGIVHAQYLNAAPHSGVEQVAIGNEVYPFLRRLAVRRLLTGYSETQLPLSQYEIARYLREVDTTQLSETERGLRRKFLRTFGYEPDEYVTVFPSANGEPLFFGGMLSDRDKYLYRWVDSATLSDLNVNGIASLEYRRREKFEPAGVALGVIGGRFHGTLSGHVGYYLEATNGKNFGDSTVALEDPLIGKNKNFTLYSKNNYDFTIAELSYNNDWFTAKIAREPYGIGGGFQGDNVILSPLVPYYDFVSLGGHVGGVRYTATVASLLDETRRELDSIEQSGPGARIDNKFMTVHHLTFQPTDYLEIGFTDIVVFASRFDLAYLNPFSFLKSVEHSLNDRDNGLLAVHARLNLGPIELRGQGLMDDVYAPMIGDGLWTNKFAWQAGAMWAAPFDIKDIDWSVEFTRVEPYTYSHFNLNNTFSTSGTPLGAQIGPNAMSYWSSIRWTATEDLTIEVQGQLVRRGENIYDSLGRLIENWGADFEQTIRNEEEKHTEIHILDGLRSNVFSLTGSIQYEPVRGLILFARGTNKSVSYLNQVPAKPREHSELQLSFGARALF